MGAFWLTHLDGNLDAFWLTFLGGYSSLRSIIQVIGYDYLEMENKYMKRSMLSLFILCSFIYAYTLSLMDKVSLADSRHGGRVRH